MNTIKKNLTYIVAFLLALGFASLANAEANKVSDLVDGANVTQSLDLNQNQTDVQQSVQPSCGNDMQDEGSFASSTGLGNLTPNTSWLCYCCYAGNIGCCIAAGNSCRRINLDSDAT